MREINVSTLTDVIERLCIDANEHLPEDVNAPSAAAVHARTGRSQKAFSTISSRTSRSRTTKTCQSARIQEWHVYSFEIGQDVHLVGGDLREAVDEGVRRGYTNGYLRKSVVKDPVRRGNTGDNTPAMLYTEIVPGENIKVTVGPKGFGSENMSQIRMFKPSAGLQGIKDFILEVVETAGPKPVSADGGRCRDRRYI